MLLKEGSKRDKKSLFYSDNFFPKNRRGQITIFIIVAVLIVAIIALYFILRGQITPRGPGISEEINPESFLETCIEEKVTETIETLSLQGGYMENPLSINFKFGNEPYRDISYLCYTSTNYLPCIVQQPSIINHMERKLEEELGEELSACFDNLVYGLGKKDYITAKEYNGFEADLVKNKLKIKLDAELTLTKAEQTSKQEDFEIEFSTKLYNIGKVVHEIIKHETKWGSFDEIHYMSMYPEYNINLYKTSDSTKIYTIEHEESKEKFRFAVRGGVLP